MVFENGKTYDILKLVAMVIMPLADLIAALANIWGLPYGSQIVATLVAIHAFLSAFVKVSSDKYHDKQVQDNVAD